MKQWESFDEIIDFAVKAEEEAAAFYRNLAGKAETDDMKKTLESFAREEDGHKARLLSIREKGYAIPAPTQVADLKIADYLVDVDPTEELDYAKILVLAMKREKKAFALYTKMAGVVTDAPLKNLFENLAQEEAKHKLRFEIEYDDYVYREN